MWQKLLTSDDLIYLLLGLAFVLPKIPIIGRFFRVIYTMVHELGHVLATLLLGGEIKKVELFSDTSGAAYTQNKNRFFSALTAFMGYPFGAAVAYFSFFLIEKNCEIGFVIGLTVTLFVMLVFWIRNVYGFIWAILFLAMNGALIYYVDVQYVTVVAQFYACLLAAESLYSSFTVFYLSLKQAQNSGDAALLRKTAYLPAFIWGFLFLAISVFVSVGIVLHFLIS